jgi:16S rRNA C1402 (ribose-2'-O) methylase RsmI
MTPKKAREILDSEDVVSMEDIMEAHAVLDKLKKKKKIKDPNASINAHNAWKLRKQEEFNLRKEIRKYWNQKTS